MKRFLYSTILPFIGWVFIRLLSLTYRIQVINKENESGIITQGKLPIYASWHQRLLPGITFLSSRKPIAVIVSMSKDGDLIAQIIKWLGWRPVRGSSSKGGIKALKELKSLFNNGYSIGHVVDGPRGPFGIVKPGIIMIAGISGMPILPIGISIQKKWTANSWDKFLVPKPFSKIIIKFDDPIYIPKKINKDDQETYRVKLENTMIELYRELDQYWD